MKIYRVKSRTNPNIIYNVRYFSESGKFTCDCPSYAFGKIGFECKHIDKTKKYLEQKKEKIFVIKTKEEYEKIKIEVEKLSKIIKGNWFIKGKVKQIDKITGKEKDVEILIDNKKYKTEMDNYEELVNSLLSYEIEQNLLPI